MKKTGPLFRGLAVAVMALACATVAKAHPYASSLTNSTSGGTNFVSFYLNEGGGTVSVVTYPSGTSNSLGTLPAGATNFALPAGDTSYTISVAKTGTGVPSQISTDNSWNVWNGGVLPRAIAVNPCAQFGDSFGRVNIGITGQTATDSGAGGPAFRGWGLYSLTPDMVNNALYGGKNPTPAVAVLQTNTLTFTAAATNGQTFVMDGATLTWSTNATNLATQVAVTNSAAASATNLAAALNLNLAAHGGTVSVSVSGTVVTLVQFAQNTSGAPYFTYATSGYSGPWANDFATGNAGFGYGPYRMNVNPADGTVWVTDTTDGNANCLIFGRNFESTNQLWNVTGKFTGEAALEHGNVNDVAMRGTLAQGNLQVWTADNDMPIPTYFNNTNNGTLGNGGVGNLGSAQETIVGDVNVIYRYDVLTSASSYPVTNTPVYACTLGLNGGFAGSQVCSVAVGPNTNYVYAAFRRANFSDGNLQVFRADTGARVYTSLAGTAASPNDVFSQDAAGSNQGCYGVRISPDGRYLAGLFADGYIAVVNLTNGLPDVSSMFYVTNANNVTTCRELSWDAADNLYTASSGTTFTREFSLGLTTTCVTSNDVTGTNGSFQIVVPPANVTVANAGDASQNYGTPIVGNINLSLNTSSNAAPVVVAFKIGGTGTNTVNYNILNFSNISGVVVVTNAGNIGTVTFPAGVSGSGNWNVNIPITPTASPVVGPTLTVVLTVQAGSTYIKGSPSVATVKIFNTGPQFFFVSASPTATTMSRAINSDYAEFIINRWGDLNGPSNSVGNVTPKTITVTNFTLSGTAVFPTDYTAGVQPFVPGQAPVNGSASVAFAPGVSSQVVLVGNPVSHANALLATTNVTIIPYLTNSVTGTNVTSAEGYSYFVNTATTTLTEFDNAQGTLAEVVLWSDPLTNSAGANYAVTYSGANMATNSVLPVYLPNYQYTNGGAANGSGANLSAPSNYFDVMLGFPINTESTWEDNSGIFGNTYPNPPPSSIMAANGWSNVLRMTVDKQSGQVPTQCAVNFFPTTNTFVGNYALRFDMYLSIWSAALSNPGPLAYPRNFAAFGINTKGTNCDWRVSTATGIPNANNPTNSDGVWFAIDAADQSLTPADFDGFVSPQLPNNGTTDIISATAQTQSGVFKRPPFPATDGAGAGTPINTWVNVSVETKANTNVTLLMDNSVIFQNVAFTNTGLSAPNTAGIPSGNYTNGTPMLGYMQPYNAQSDESAFVYYSNVRIVELSPYIITQPLQQLVLAGSTVTIPTFASYASQNLTNTLMRGTTAPATVVSTHSLTGTNFTVGGISYYGTNDSMTLTNVVNGSNYWSVWSDRAGSITSAVCSVEVIAPPATQAVTAGSKATFTVTASGPSAPVLFQWQTNGVNLANGTKYTNVTTASLSVSNSSAADAAVTYSCIVKNWATNLLGLYVVTNQNTLTTPGAALVIAVGPTSATVSPASQTNLWGSSANFTVSVTGGSPAVFTYQWKKNGTNITGATTSSLTLNNVVTTNAGSYTCGVTNAGGGVLSSAGVLTVNVTSPSFSGITANGSSVTLNFGSSNGNDTTNAFTLLSSPFVGGPYTNTTATITTNGTGGFQVVQPENTGTNMFYKLQHKP